MKNGWKVYLVLVQPWSSPGEQIAFHPAAIEANKTYYKGLDPPVEGKVSTGEQVAALYWSYFEVKGLTESRGSIGCASIFLQSPSQSASGRRQTFFRKARNTRFFVLDSVSVQVFIRFLEHSMMYFR